MKITLPSGHTIKQGTHRTRRDVIPSKEFWRALAESEQRAIAGSGTQAAKAFLWELSICDTFTPQDVLAALNRMEAATLITAERKAEIINALR